MRFNYLKALKTAILAVTVLFLAVGVSSAQQVVDLTAGPSTITLPDGSLVPMWGYTCGTVALTGPGCRPLNPAATGWSPVVITVPTGQGLTINLRNHLSFGTTPINLPTSIVIVGQLGGGLGTPGGSTASPTHGTQPATTWPVVDPSATNMPPPQSDRVRSFSTEVPGTPASSSAFTPLPWPAATLRPGTYLIESGTHPSIQGPMGLYGILVVTDATNGTAYPGVTYGADIPLLFSEIDPVQNATVAAAVATPGFSETAPWSGQTGQCGNPASANYLTCYPPAVNYTPLYYLINGVAFDKSNAVASLFPTAPTTGVAGTVLVRMVNAGLRMHVPSIVGSLTTPAVVPTGVTAVPVAGLSLVAEDGNPLPGVTRVQSEVFMAAGKAYDVMVNVPAGGTALPIFDRQGSLSANATARDAGMLAYISINSAGPPAAGSIGAAIANADSYASVISGQTLTVSDPAKGVIANDVNVYGVQVSGTAPAGLILNANGTFTYTGPPTSFTYCANGTTTVCALVTLGAAPIEAGGGITVADDAYTSKVATALSIKSPGVLVNDKDAAGYPLTVALSGANAPVPQAGLTLSVDASGAFNASVAAPGAYTFTYKAQNSQGTVSALAATVTLTFPQPSNLAVSLIDGKTKQPLPGTPQDYRWIIEEDRTFYIDPNCTSNPLPATCPAATPQGAPATLGVNFHTSYMPVVAQGCTGPISCEAGQSVLGVASVCDVGNGACRPGSGKTPVLPSSVYLDPTKRYYISVLPGDAIGVDPFGVDLPDSHAMGGAQIAAGQRAVSVIVEPQNMPPSKLSVFVFEDDHPLNGEHDAGGGIDTLSPNEPGLGGFNITIFDDVGGTGDAAGQMTYDEFGQPLSNSLAGTPDPTNAGVDACPITANPNTGFDGQASPTGITGVIPVCPKYESDGTTLSPLAGQAVVVNMPPGRYGIVATPAADRIARGEEWLQTNTLDGGKAHDSFLRIGEPSFFQEFGPAGYHVAIGFANPAIIAAAGQALCPSTAACPYTVSGTVAGVHMSRPSDERLYGTGSRDTFGYTQCFTSLGTVDGADFTFAKCADDGSFTLTGVPAGDWRLTIFDQWNDQIVDGISTAVRVTTGNVTMPNIAVHAWKNNLTTRTCFDVGDGNVGSPGYGDGVCQDNEPGLALIPTNIRFRDGSISNLNSTDLNGNAGFNEVFPLFSWYVMETDSTRYKNTGTHVVNDAGGPVDHSPVCNQPGYPACTNSTATYDHMARTHEDFPLPANLRVPGARYCANPDCPTGDTAGGSTGRVDPPWVTSYGWQSFAGQNQYLEFGKVPFAPGENGGIRGHVVYASTRPFDDPALLLQLTWEPMVPHVTINLYQEGTAPDGSKSLTMVDTTTTSSWDDWAQGFRSDGIPNMNCPGQSTTDPFYFTLFNQPNYLNPGTALPSNSQFKCYDGLHNWNQLQPAPYDGMYQFPSIIGRNPTTGAPAGAGSTNGTAGTRPGSNCTICVAAPDGNPMLPAGKYVVEMIVPPGYELVKEEDKNILLGDAYEGPVTSQFAGFGNIFIMPDQASVAATYNPNNPLMPTTNQGVTPRHEGDTGSVETFWPCVGAARVVPDYMSLFPGSGQNAPFAGATRNLCDRKEVTLEDQMSVLAKFYVFSSVHVAGHYTGIITDDFTSEFDPFSPHFGEKFSPANLPVGVKDWAGNEVGRVYSDWWGIYDGLNYSTFSVNPPDPSGYIPTMMVMCMNDRGSAVAQDPLYQSSYSQFCYELPFMPGQTGYFDTPVIPTTAFAEGYNHPDCAYPDATPAISQVNGQGGVGPWVSAPGQTLTITALGDQAVNNYGYSGPVVTTAPYNAKTVTRHYGFGAAAGSVALVGSDGVPHDLTGVSWSDSTITGTVPSGVPACSVQQQAQYGGSAAQCGELIITAANGKQSVDTVTVTIGGKAPTRLTAGQTIQSAIDAASPGDLIIVPPGTYSELVLMWKPVRLQGVGGASSIIDANPHPAGKLDPWRQRVVCLFGLGVDGAPASWNSGCAADLFGNNVAGFVGDPTNPQVDRLPLEATVGWTATLNGNLAEQLQEPTLMGAYEGAGITVLSKGVRFPAGSDPFAADTFPAGTALLTTGTNANNCGPDTTTAHNRFPSSFQCNPSRIDGLSITNSSQGGGGIFVHAWAHNLEIANNRISNNQGTLAGGISVGQGEHPDAYLAGGIIPDPGSCQTSNVTNTQLPYCFDRFVNIHHNAITTNSSEGDELFSATPSGAGGVAVCTGADNYQFNYNWVCGNMSTGDGAGVSQLGFALNGSVQHNSILFNQSINPTTPTNGGGLLIMGAPDTDPTCPGEPDQDCNLAFGTVGDGTGRNLVINANLIMGNAAEAGAGGGIRLQGINGSEVGFFPTRPLPVTTGPVGQRSPGWNSISVTNNIITNNVAGWDGGGVSLQDALVVNLVNNTIVSNDSTASSGVLFGAFFADQASAPTPCSPQGTRCSPLSPPQPAGLSSGGHSSEFLASIAGINITCPAGHGAGGTGTGGLVNGACRRVSFPILYNDVFWQNRAFNIVVTTPATGAQQATVAVAPSLNQATTGQCVGGASYWDIGLRGDTGPTNHSSGVTFTPQASVLTNITGYAGGGTGFRGNTASNPALTSQYCNGSRVPPELGSAGYIMLPGTNESNVPVPVFNLTAGATVDEGNNWINLSWGPLSLVNPSTNVTLGNYALSAGSAAISYIFPTGANSSPTTYAAAPADDFFGTLRKTNGAVDVGAVEFGAGPPVLSATVTPNPLAFGNWAAGTTNVTSAPQTLTVTNTGNAVLAGGTFTFGGGTPQPFSRITTGTFPAGAPNCGAALAVGASCTIKVVFAPATAVAFSRTLTFAYTGATVTPTPVTLTGTGVTARATVSITPNPLTITLPTGSITGTGVVTLTNTAAAGGSQVAVTNVAVSGGSILTYFYLVGVLAGPDTCTGAAVAPGASCTVTVRFTNVLSPRGANRAGAITFTDTGAGGPQASGLVGFATP
jgi:hypothetical protein